MSKKRTKLPPHVDEDFEGGDFNSDSPEDESFDSDSNLPISKSERKRQMHRAQTVGESLIALSAEQLSELPVEGSVVDAVLEAKRIQSREGLRRQKQYIGKLMRSADVEAIASAVEALSKDQQLATRDFHQLETLRAQLISGGKESLGEVIALFPQIDTQKLRQLVKRAKQEVATNQGNPVAQRALFRFLRQAQEEKAQVEQEQ